MKPDEERFFVACYKFGLKQPLLYSYPERYITPREVVNILAGYVHHKRCWYYLEKWVAMGFYEYGVTLDLGWFWPDKLPERYKKLLEET